MVSDIIAPSDIPDIYNLSTLSTDFAPDSSQMRLLRAGVEEKKNVLVTLNSELESLQLRAHKLHDQISEVERTLRFDEALLSPTRRLAPETLGEVFLHCLPKDAVVTMTPTTAPLLLTHVSRRWRRVAYGTPHLWEKLYLGRGFAHKLQTLVPIWLINSGALPLDIRVNVEDWRFDSNHRLNERNLVSMLIPSIHRCISFVASLSTVAIEILFHHDLLMPHLESLELMSPIWSPAVVPVLGDLQAPRLRSIALHDTGFVTTALRGPLPTLRHLELTGQDTFGFLSHSSCLAFIARCPNLQSCALTLSRNPGMPIYTHIVLESLVHLHLIFKFSPHDPIPFLSALHTPHIERLTLQNHGGVSPVPHIRRVLTLLLSGRPHTIRELNLSSLFVHTNDWVPSLRELTELTSLSITGDSLDEGFFKVLTPEDALAPWVCPKLMILKLHHVVGLVGLSGDRLVAFIRSRSRDNDMPMGMRHDYNRLSHVHLNLCDLEQRHKEELREIERECNGSLRLHGLNTAYSESRYFDACVTVLS